MDRDLLNAPRWEREQSGAGAPGYAGFYEAWFIVASDARTGAGIWLRYAVDVSTSGVVQPSVWGAFFDPARPERTFSINNVLPAAAIRRGNEHAIAIGAAELSATRSLGEVEAGGHSLRWRLELADAPDDGGPQEVAPSFLRPVARLKRSGYVFPRPALKLSGALEVDGAPLELRAHGLQAHLSGVQRYPGWAWAHCSSFEEAPDSALDLVSVLGPAGVWVPLYSFRFQGKVHRFSELPWIALCTSRRASPAWHFSAQDATLALDGVVRADLQNAVEVQYVDPDGSKLYCVNTEVAHAELRLRTRSFPGAPWRPEGTLRSAFGAGLEFCGRYPDARVTNKLVSAARTEAYKPTGAASGEIK